MSNNEFQDSSVLRSYTMSSGNITEGMILKQHS